MNNILKKSFDRAIDLLDTPPEYENYISIKIKPTHRGCCCFHCWPKTWDVINEYIFPCGPLEDEGDVLINKNNEKFVLECHESGPEIIVYLGFCTASIVLIKSIIDLITTFLKTLQNGHQKHPGQLKIIKRYQIKGQVEEEEIIEIELPLSDDITKKLNDNIRNVLEERNE